MNNTIESCQIRFTDRRYENPGNSGGTAIEWNAWSSIVTQVNLIFSCQQVFSAFIHAVPTTKWFSRLIWLLNDFGTLPDSLRLSTLLLLTPPIRALLEDTEVKKARVFCGIGNFYEHLQESLPLSLIFLPYFCYINFNIIITSVRRFYLNFLLIILSTLWFVSYWTLSSCLMIGVHGFKPRPFYRLSLRKFFLIFLTHSLTRR